MDNKTSSAYSSNAKSYSDDWLTQPEPVDMYAESDILHFEDKISASSGKRVCRLIWKTPI